MGNLRNKRIVVYTDGACSVNPGPGGFCTYAIFFDEHNKFQKRVICAEYSEATTNNEMELTAFYYALELLNAYLEQEDSKFRGKLEIISDSQYCTKAISDKWLLGWNKANYLKDGSPRSNAELWKAVYKVYYKTALKDRVKISWIKGHLEQGSGNDLCDKFAVQCYKTKQNYFYELYDIDSTVRSLL